MLGAMTTRGFVRFDRAMALASAAIAIAAPTVLACGGVRLLRDPLGFAGMAIGGAAIGYPYLLLFLGSSRLRWSLPVAGVFTSAAIAIAFHTLGLFGVFVAFAISTAVMALCGCSLRDGPRRQWGDSWGTSLVVAAAVLAMVVLGGVCGVGALLALVAAW
jgi:hypothetical protein